MNLSDLKEIWLENSFRPEKSLGQNFLVDNNIRDKLINAYAPKNNETVVEIGPGFGMMTFRTASVCRRVIAVEKDSRICGIMEPLFIGGGNITLLNKDILEVDIAALAPPGEKMKVIGNIPYCISTPIIDALISSRRSVASAYLVMQDELVDRIVSPPGSREHGSISCFVQYFTKAKKAFRISRNCFFPRPAVDSSLLALEFLPEPSVKVSDEKLFFTVIRRAYSERRKRVINPLSAGGFLGMDKKDWERIFTNCRVDPLARAEDLTLEEFARISDAAADLSRG
ncbi:MAG: 16S rRNA (adenine(1518)-N(6)/adenine(1519)-N(6))-dimethyltransferase RsmA [Candidatus Omnitrophica bacterium]|nr:16S rRNA (adenine(1518)-N(6)/adenine(1519)-N(6))-dimethyltransferase RsmA [Candidatus Omnitrophota bacterium]